MFKFLTKDLKVIDKSYNEDAYVFNLHHKKIINNSARQFFLKDGPLAFLPVSSIDDHYAHHTRIFTAPAGP